MSYFHQPTKSSATLTESLGTYALSFSNLGHTSVLQEYQAAQPGISGVGLIGLDWPEVYCCNGHTNKQSCT